MRRKLSIYDYLILAAVVVLFVVWFYTHENWLRYAVWAGCGIYFFRRLYVAYLSTKENKH